MKIYILFIFVLLSVSLCAQSLLPKAGEFSSDKIKTQLPQMLMSGNQHISDIIDFDSSNVSWKGNYPFSESWGLAISDSGNLVFVGSGGGIYVTDVSNPQNPVIVSEVRTRSLVDNCTYNPVTKQLYVCAYFSGIEIWNLNDLNNPVRMSRIPTDPYPRSGVAFSGDYIFFTVNNSILSYDISNPYNPVKADELFITSNLLLQMFKKDNTIYTVADAAGLTLIDIIDPLDLKIIGNSPYGAGGRFDIEGDYFYSAGYNGVFTVLNISNPLNITFTGSLNIGGFPEDVTVVNNKAYISKLGTDGGVQIINIANPSSPQHIALYPGNYRFIEGFQNHVYVTVSSTFSILDVSDPLSVQYVSGYEFPGFVEDIAVRGKFAYTGSNGFRVMDVSDSTHPVQVGYSDIDGLLVEMVNDSVVAYCPKSMSANNTVHIMDVSDPTNPVSLDSYLSPVMTVDLAVKDNVAFVACWWDGIRLLNIEDPSNISLISHTMGWVQGGIPGTDWFYAQALAVEGNYLYVVDYGPFAPNEDTYGLYILDITNLSSPVLLNRFRTNMTSYPQDVSVKNGIIYIADGQNGGLEIINVNDPMNPQVIDYVDLIDGATGIDVDGVYAYLSNYILGGIQIVDISIPSSSFLAGWYKPSGCFALGIEANNGYVYAADGIAGFQIYRNLLVEPIVPVELLNFTISFNNNKVILLWSTASETNNRGFEIEFKSENNQWQTRGFVQGKGTTTEKQNYSFEDENILDGKYVYRLKQIDFDGKYKYSDQVKIDVNTIPSVFSLSQNYPNPFNPSTKIEYSVPISGNISLKIFNSLGQEIAVLVNEFIKAGNYKAEFDASNLPSGVYFYKLESNGTTLINKMVLIK